MRRRPRFRSRRSRGIAEIVGTLMLILIVVAAAIALAAFVASYEKQVLAEESQSQQRGLESLKILSVTPVLNLTTPGVVANFTFVLASEYINPSQIDSIDLNGEPLERFWALNLADIGGKRTEYDTSSPFVLSAREEAIVSVNLSSQGGKYPYGNFSLFDDSFVLTTSDYIEISMYTQLQNTFTQVFIPPTAVGFVTDLTSYSSGSPVLVPLLDGTQSFQPGTNASIVQWGWTLFDQTNGTYIDCFNGVAAMTAVTCLGDEFELSWLGTWTTSTTGSFLANLTVTNSDQLSGEDSVAFSYTGELAPP